jgi:hypothetical protein
MPFDRRSFLSLFLGAPIGASVPVLAKSLRPATASETQPFLPTGTQSSLSPLPPELDAWLSLRREPIRSHLDIEYPIEHAQRELRDELTSPDGTRARADIYRDRLRELDLVSQLLPLVNRGGPLRFTYHGGSTPGESRTVLPTMLFTVPDDWCEVEDLWPEMDPIYLLAHCTHRNAPRIFRISRITI